MVRGILALINMVLPGSVAEHETQPDMYGRPVTCAAMHRLRDMASACDKQHLIPDCIKGSRPGLPESQSSRHS